MSRSSSIFLHSLPKDILLRKVAALLEDDEIIFVARSSRILLSSLHQAKMRQPCTLQNFIRYRPHESRPLLAALRAEEIKQLQTSGVIRPTPRATSAILPHLAIGCITHLIRYRVHSASHSEHDFLLSHLHHLPREIRCLHLSSISDAPSSVDVDSDCFIQLSLSYSKLSLPSHLTELRFLNSGYRVPAEQIEKLYALEVLELPLGQLENALNVQEAFEEKYLGGAEEWDDEDSKPKFSAKKKQDPLIHFPSTIHTLITGWYFPISPTTFTFPPALTSLDIKQAEWNQEEQGEFILPPLPPTLTHLAWANVEVANDAFVHMIRKELLPSGLETIDLAYDLRIPNGQEPLVWKSAALKTMRISYLDTRGPIILPIDPLTGICSLTSLKLPERVNHYLGPLAPLHEMTSLTHLSDFLINDLKALRFPDSLTRLEFSSEWVKSLKEWIPPTKLREIKFGFFSDISLSNLTLPHSVESIHFGASFTHAPPANYPWPTSLRTLIFSSFAARQLWETYSKAVPARVRIFVPRSTRGVVAGRIRYTEYRTEEYEQPTDEPNFMQARA